MSDMAWKGHRLQQKVQHMQMAHGGMWLHPGDWKKEKDNFKLEACEAISAPCQGLSNATNQSNTSNPYQRRSVSRKNDHIHLLIPQTPPYQPRSLSRPSFPDDLPLWGRQSSGVLLRRVEALRALPRREDGH